LPLGLTVSAAVDLVALDLNGVIMFSSGSLGGG
jgi:hypothetical protein